MYKITFDFLNQQIVWNKVHRMNFLFAIVYVDQCKFKFKPNAKAKGTLRFRFDFISSLEYKFIGHSSKTRG